MNTNNAFMEMIQLHERTWGMEQYPERPSLTQLISSPIVVMWVNNTQRPERADARLAALNNANSGERFMLSVHNAVEELNALLVGIVLIGKPSPVSTRRISKVYLKQQPVEITGVQLVFARPLNATHQTETLQHHVKPPEKKD